MLLHLGRPGARGGLMSWPSDVMAVNHETINETNKDMLV